MATFQQFLQEFCDVESVRALLETAREQADNAQMAQFAPHTPKVILVLMQASLAAAMGGQPVDRAKELLMKSVEEHMAADAEAIAQRALHSSGGELVSGIDKMYLREAKDMIGTRFEELLELYCSIKPSTHTKDTRSSPLDFRNAGRDM